MEVETRVGIRCLHDTHEAERRIQHVCRVSTYGREPAIEVDRYAEHPGRRIRNEVRNVLRRRNTPVDPPHNGIVASVDVVHHRAAVDDASALTKDCAAEIAGVPYECGVAERESGR